MSIMDVLRDLANRIPEPDGPIKEIPETHYCPDCRLVVVEQDGQICQECQTDRERGYRITRLTGRCANGAERDGGTRYHAIPLGKYKALCGAEPGRRSVGWSVYRGNKVTCPRCLRILQKQTEGIQ